jgi:hypothetical protein
MNNNNNNNTYELVSIMSHPHHGMYNMQYLCQIMVYLHVHLAIMSKPSIYGIKQLIIIMIIIESISI